jgi:hypothetical protein
MWCGIAARQAPRPPVRSLCACGSYRRAWPALRLDDCSARFLTVAVLIVIQQRESLLSPTQQDPAKRIFALRNRVLPVAVLIVIQQRESLVSPAGSTRGIFSLPNRVFLGAVVI